MVRTGKDGDSTRSSSKMTTTTTTISGDLCKKIVSNYHGCDKRIPNETADAIGEVLRLFIVEARARASIEAECDLEGGMDLTNDENTSSTVVSIRADHVTKIAAELLMDFS